MFWQRRQLKNNKNVIQYQYLCLHIYFSELIKKMLREGGNEGTLEQIFFEAKKRHQIPENAKSQFDQLYIKEVMGAPGEIQQKSEIVNQRLKKFFIPVQKKVDFRTDFFKERRDIQRPNETKIIDNQLLLYGIDYIKPRQIKAKFQCERVTYVDASHYRLSFASAQKAMRALKRHISSNEELQGMIKLEEYAQEMDEDNQKKNLINKWFAVQSYTHKSFERKLYCRFVCQEDDKETYKVNEAPTYKEAKSQYQKNKKESEERNQRFRVWDDHQFRREPLQRRRRNQNHHRDEDNFSFSSRSRSRSREKHYRNFQKPRDRLEGNNWNQNNQYQSNNNRRNNYQGDNYSQKNRAQSQKDFDNLSYASRSVKSKKNRYEPSESASVNLSFILNPDKEESMSISGINNKIGNINLSFEQDSVKQEVSMEKKKDKCILRYPESKENCINLVSDEEQN